MTQVVLASASAGRLRVLRQAGIDPLVVVSGVDEDAVMASMTPGTPPEAVVASLANEKALSVAARLDADVLDDCVVIGCDSMLYRDGTLWGKPGSAEAAREQWTALSNSVGHLLTGHSLIRTRSGVIAQTEVATGSTTVHFTSLSQTELSSYLHSGEPLNVAGGFTLDGLGGWFIERIEGDPSNVVGISLPLTRRMLLAIGLSVESIWEVSSTSH
jgi:septum formation protein